MSKNVPKRRFKGYVDDWLETELSEVADIIGGGTPSTSIHNYWNGNISWFIPSEIGNSIYVYESEKKITEIGMKNSSVRLLPKGTILFTSRATIGSVAILKREATTNQGFQSIVPKKDLLDKYYIFSKSKEIKNKIMKSVTGSTFLEVSGKEMKKIRINISSLPEQKLIGSFFKNLDEQISNQGKKVEKLKNLKKAYLSEMFPAEDELSPKRRFKGFTEPWKEEKLDKISHRLDNQRIPISENKRIPGNIPYYGANGIQDFVRGYTHDGEHVLLAEDGANDLIDYPVQYVLGKIWVNNHAHVLKGKENILDNKFLYVAIKNMDLRPYLVGGGRAKLNADIMMNLVILIPPFEEQKLIGSFFKKLDDEINLEQKKLEKLKQLKQAYLEEMFV